MGFRPARGSPQLGANLKRFILAVTFIAANVHMCACALV
jgi:hypothetical protein